MLASLLYLSLASAVIGQISRIPSMKTLSPENSAVQSYAPLSYNNTLPHSRRQGDISDYRSRTYRWRQLGHGVWQGIPLEEWDDAIHAKNDTTTIVRNSTSAASPAFNSGVSYTGLSRRDTFDNICRVTRACVARELTGIAFTLALVYQTIINVLAVLGPNLWDLLQHPVSLQLRVGHGIAAAAGTVYLWTEGSIKGCLCSRRYSDAEIIEGVIRRLAIDQPYRTIKLSLPAGEEVANLTIEAIASGHKANETCGPPPRMPSAIGETIYSDSTIGRPGTESHGSTANSSIDPEMQSYLHLNRVVFTRFEYLDDKVFKYAFQCLRFLLETMIEFAEDIASDFSSRKEHSPWLKLGDFRLDIGSSDGTSLSATQFRNWAETMLGAIKAGFVGTFAGYMFLDLPYVLTFDLQLPPKSFRIRT
ncbi:hypothetical protein ACLMJK_002828 [Lecanora helva]